MKINVFDVDFLVFELCVLCYHRSLPLLSLVRIDQLLWLTHHLSWINHALIISTDRREERILRLLLSSLSREAWVRHVVVAMGLKLSVRVRCLNEVLLKWIDEVWVMQVINN